MKLAQYKPEARCVYWFRFGHNAGWSSPEARLAHNQEVAGSNPVPAIARSSSMVERV